VAFAFLPWRRLLGDTRDPASGSAGTATLMDPNGPGSSSSTSRKMSSASSRFWPHVVPRSFRRWQIRASGMEIDRAIRCIIPKILPFSSTAQPPSTKCPSHATRSQDFTARRYTRGADGRGGVLLFRRTVNSGERQGEAHNVRLVITPRSAQTRAG
jgi:hypothetical protein